MATYNGEKHLRKQLESILSQLDFNDEIIISDDNSTDGTIAVIKAFNDQRIKVFRNNGKGVIQNFENAILNSSGNYIFLSDQDDVWQENKVRSCMIDFYNNYDLVVSDCVVFDSDSCDVIISSYFNFVGARKGIVRNVIKNTYIGCCMAFTDKVKDKVLPFPKNLPMHDSWIGLISEIYYNVKFNNEKLIRHRRHSSNASETGAKRGSSPILKKLKWRSFLCYNLVIHICKNFNKK
tara:strand:+ start:262 stop:969 length:708 start_codon:yes stop_codon:yes gene_type:complete